MKALSITVTCLTAVWIGGCASLSQESKLNTFLDKHETKVMPLQKEAALAYWRAATSGKAEDYDSYSALDLKLRQIYSDADDYAYLKGLKGGAAIENPLAARQVDVLINAYLTNQIEPDLLKQIVDLGTAIEKNFSTFRGQMEGEQVTDNQIKEILKTDTDVARRRAAWRASKQVGPAVAQDIIDLVKLRNQAAQALGYENYHSLSLKAAEQDPEALDRLFTELYELTNEPFARLKAEVDGMLAAQQGVDVKRLRPWHYHDPFFQETPMVYALNLDTYYKGKDIKALSVAFYNGIGLNVESILDDSDLYERAGKNPHAFCTDIDRQGDVRILCNLKPNETWMETQLHELGHAVYSKYHDPQLPYLLREPAHIFATEAIAMFFGRLSRNPRWMQQMLDLSDAQRRDIETVAGKYAQLKQLIFARWAMVMYNFEKALYADPDQDLNGLWWDMVKKYQLVRRPDRRDQPDWAAKIHFAIAPCYYHNYMLGELLASQLHRKIVHDVLKLEGDTGVSYVGQAKLGQFLRDEVFAVSARYPWNEMIERTTGEPLTAKYFVDQFVE
jgi:peptidyl-dipeptidase A